MSLGAIYADWNDNGLQDAGEANLSDVRLQFLSADGQAMLPGVVAGSWSFILDVPAGRLYYFVIRRAGFQPLVERWIAPSADGVDFVWVKLPLAPWHSGALLPLVE